MQPMQPAIQNAPWSDLIMRSFSIAGATSEKSFSGSWTRVLTTMFPPDTMFEVVPLCPPVTLRESVDFVVFFLIYVESTPVFLVESKPPGDLRLFSKRQEADEQLRRQVLDLLPDLKIPIFHAVSAFGTKLAFYKYTRDTNRMEPRRISQDLTTLMDTAPREQWAFDIVEEEGAKKFREVVEEVKEMCGKVAF